MDGWMDRQVVILKPKYPHNFVGGNIIMEAMISRNTIISAASLDTSLISP